MAKKFDATQHILVPKHTKMTEKEKTELMQKYNITPEQLPKILMTDPAIADLKVSPGDVVRIERTSQLAGKSEFYRCVING